MPYFLGLDAAISNADENQFTGRFERTVSGVGFVGTWRRNADYQRR